MTRPEACAAFDPHPCGSRNAYEAGCSKDGCRLMMVLHTANGHTPSPQRIDAEPYARIIRELLRQGLTMQRMAIHTGFTKVTIRNIALGITTWVYPATAKALTALVELLPSERVTLETA